MKENLHATVSNLLKSELPRTKVPEVDGEMYKNVIGILSKFVTANELNEQECRLAYSLLISGYSEEIVLGEILKQRLTIVSEATTNAILKEA